MCGADIFINVGEPAFFPGVSLAAAQKVSFSAGITRAHSRAPGLTTTQVQKPGRGWGSTKQALFEK